MMWGGFMTEQKMQLMLNIDAGPETDDEELEQLTRQLREELLELDVEAVDLVSKGKSPKHAKAGDLIAWGQLLLTLAASGGVFVTLINMLQYWLTRQGVSIEMDINGNKVKLTSSKSSKEELQRLIDTYIAVITKKHD
jgi:cytoskeletal protein RodZ